MIFWGVGAHIGFIGLGVIARGDFKDSSVDQGIFVVGTGENGAFSTLARIDGVGGRVWEEAMIFPFYRAHGGDVFGHGIS